MTCLKQEVRAKQYINVLAKEVVRKLIHLCAAWTPLMFHVAYFPTLILLLTALAGYCVAENLRVRGKTVPFVSAITAAAARKRDENRFVLGPVTLAIGVILAAVLFDPIPAAIGILALAFGDGLASLAGKCFGTIRIPFVAEKTAVGSISCFTAIFLTTFAVTKSASTALITAFVGMVLEIIPLRDFDNILLPVAVAALNQFFL